LFIKAIPASDVPTAAIHEPDAISNMEELLRLQTGADGDGLERAELFRELGRWQEARQALGHVQPRDAFESARAEAIARGIDEESALPLVVDLTRARRGVRKL
jgi:hypothetical protein